MSYIRGKYARASCDLIDDLARVGIVATVGYSEPRDGKLYAYVRDPRHIPLVPSEFCGFPVVVDTEKNMDEATP